MKKDRNEILLSMIKEYPMYFLKEHPRLSNNMSLVDEISEKYDLHPRKIYREKKVLLEALKIATADGRIEVNLEDIVKTRNRIKKNESGKTISFNKLNRLLSAVDPILAKKVMKIVMKWND